MATTTTDRDLTVFSWGAVTTPSLLPDGRYDFEVTAVRSEWSQENHLKMYVIEMVVLAPQTEAGKIHREFCVFGKNPFAFDPQTSFRRDDPRYVEFAALDDPEGTDPLNAAYSSGMRKFKYLFQEAEVAFTEMTTIADIQDRVAAGGVRVGAVVTQKATNRGQNRNELPTFYLIGSQAAQINTGAAAQGVSNSRVNGRTPSQSQARPAGTAAQAAATGRTRADVEAELASLDRD